MNGLVTLRHVKLQGHHTPAGKTKHYYGLERVPVPLPVSLAISKYEGDDGFYLLYLDDNGNDLTDTYHLSIDKALLQAEWEFGVKSDEWQVVA
jgi:hypothetical protein